MSRAATTAGTPRREAMELATLDAAVRRDPNGARLPAHVRRRAVRDYHRQQLSKVAGRHGEDI